MVWERQCFEDIFTKDGMEGFKKTDESVTFSALGLKHANKLPKYVSLFAK